MGNRVLAVAMLLALAGCSGVYIGVPIGPVSVGTTVSPPHKDKEKAFEDTPEAYDDGKADSQDGKDKSTNKQ